LSRRERTTKKERDRRTALVLLIVILIALDVALWIAAVAAPLTATGRFRALVAAAALLITLSAQAIGWPWTAALAALGIWLAAIILGNAPGSFDVTRT
jgi:hypothetical protein